MKVITTDDLLRYDSLKEGLNKLRDDEGELRLQLPKKQYNFVEQGLRMLTPILKEYPIKKTKGMYPFFSHREIDNLARSKQNNVDCRLSLSKDPYIYGDNTRDFNKGLKLKLINNDLNLCVTTSDPTEENGCKKLSIDVLESENYYKTTKIQEIDREKPFFSIVENGNIRKLIDCGVESLQDTLGELGDPEILREKLDKARTQKVVAETDLNSLKFETPDGRKVTF